MHISEHSLHFILDQDNDVHFTDSILTLDSPHFIWYQLRRSGSFRNILLLRLGTDDHLYIDVYDNESEQFLQHFRKPLISWRDTSDQVLAARFPELWLFEDEMLQKLIDKANERKIEGRTALVFTRKAYDQVCRHASDKSCAALMSLLSAPADRCMLFLQLPYRSQELEQLLKPDSTECLLLTETYKLLRLSSGDDPVPLLQAMTNVLGSQLLRLDDQPQEMLHLLLKHNAADAANADTLDALADQAKYLELCRTRRIGPFRARPDSEQFTPLSRRQTADWLQDPSIREQLRRCSPLQLPPSPPPVPAYTDELSRSALGISLKGSNCLQEAEWSIKLDMIKRNLITIWDRPRNIQSVDYALELCRSARSAISNQNWLCMEELMEILKFFAMPKQLCASEARWKAQDHIRQKSRELIRQCNYIHGKNSFASAVGFAAINNTLIDAGDMATLKNLHDIVSFDLRYFDKPESSQSEDEGIEEYYGRVQQSLESSELAIRARNELSAQTLLDDPLPNEDECSLTPEFLEADSDTSVSESEVIDQLPAEQFPSDPYDTDYDYL